MSGRRDRDIVFRIDAALAPQLEAWMLAVDQRVAAQQVRTGEFFNGYPLSEGVLEVVKDSLERGDPLPYYGVSGGAYTYSFTPTSIGCVIKVANTETGDEIELTDYDSW